MQWACLKASLITLHATFVEDDAEVGVLEGVLNHLACNIC
jgi:hypothetical protein